MCAMAVALDFASLPTVAMDRSITTAPTTALVLPRHALDQCLVSAARGAGMPLWHGAAVLQAVNTTPAAAGTVHVWTGPLELGPPQRLPAAQWRQQRLPGIASSSDLLAMRPARAFVLLALAGAAEVAPDQGRSDAADRSAAWDGWLARVAPDLRLATPALRPDVAVLWLRPHDGLVRALLRPGQGWQAAVGYPPGAPRWQAFDHLHLPGAEQLTVPLTGPVPAPVRPAAEGPDEADNPDGRYSRMRGALGAAVLQRLQRSTIGLVGTGRAGSMLAHSLARMGCSLCALDPDAMSPHSLDGDLPPLHEGRPKVVALHRQLRGLLRPGASLELRQLAVSSPAAGAVLAGVDLIVCATDNDAARLWADAWGLAMHKPRLVVASGLHAHGAEADLRLLLPGAGCLCCTGGFAQLADLPAQLSLAGPVPTPATWQQQRPGSLRSWNGLVTHAGLRLLEHLLAGRVRQTLFRHLAETAEGTLQVRDWTPPPERRRQCELCRHLEGAGSGAVRAELLHAAVSALQAAAPRQRTSA